MSKEAKGVSMLSGSVAAAVEQMSNNLNSVAAAIEEASTNISMVATSSEEMMKTISKFNTASRFWHYFVNCSPSHLSIQLLIGGPVTKPQ
jgi:uncharacterized protein YoxC